MLYQEKRWPKTHLNKWPTRSSFSISFQLGLKVSYSYSNMYPQLGCWFPLEKHAGMDIPTQSSVVASYKSLYCLSYRREHNLYTFLHLYAIQSMKTLFQLILAACLEFRNPEPWGLPVAWTNPLFVGTGTLAGNKIKIVFQGRKPRN